MLNSFDNIMKAMKISHSPKLNRSESPFIARYRAPDMVIAGSDFLLEDYQMGKRIDLTGLKFGRLEVINEAGRDKQKGVNWKCYCECGNDIVVSSHSLRRGNTKSCGCLQKDIIKEIGYSNQIHGMSHTKIWRRWHDMKRRCFDNKVKAFKNYGGRGITVCNE